MGITITIIQLEHVLFPIIRDLINSLHSGDWILYISAMGRASTLFFFFGRTNYCQWTLLFLQDHYKLKDTFPLLMTPTWMMDSSWMLPRQHQEREWSTLQLSTKAELQPASQNEWRDNRSYQKERCSTYVALWEIIKPKKDLNVDLLKKKIDIQEELSPCHDFNPSTTTHFGVESMQSSTWPELAVLKNVLTVEMVTNVKVNTLICCIRKGHEAYTEENGYLRNHQIMAWNSVAKIVSMHS